MWTAHLFKVTTGAIGPRLNFETAKWSTSLNDIESFGFQIRKSDLPKVDLDFWLAPWWAGVVYMWNGTPIVAGPIISRPYESYDRIDLDCVGIRSILTRRYVTAELANWSQLAASSITYKGLSLGTIAQRVVKQAQAKSGGALPISYPIPEQTAANDADHTRTYRGFNIQNISADDILTKLSDVIDGPDIMFRPRLVDPSELTFDMLHGTEDRPRIAQTHTPTWDITPEFGSVSHVQVVSTGTYQTNRVFGLGAGQDTKRLIRVATHRGPITQGFPLLETEHNAGNSENATVVQNHANSSLLANLNMLQEIQFTVRADGSTPVTQFYPGMTVKLAVKGLLSLEDGVHDAILLNMNGDHQNNVKLSLQTLDRYTVEDKSRIDVNDAV